HRLLWAGRFSSRFLFVRPSVTIPSWWNEYWSGSKRRALNLDRLSCQMRRMVFHTWLIPVVWATLAVLACFFPGGENIGLLSGLLPGVLWLGNGASTFLLFLTGAATMAIVGAMADWRRVPRTRWLRCFAFSTGAVFGVLAMSFVSEVMRTSLVNAWGKFDLDDA